MFLPTKLAKVFFFFLLIFSTSKRIVKQTFKWFWMKLSENNPLENNLEYPKSHKLYTFHLEESIQKKKS